ncbi:phage tail protein [Bacillota bacterium Lsc_1132]
MAGTYIEGSSKPLSGVYTLIKAALASVTMGSRGIVAYPFTANWGPINSLEKVLQELEFKKKYNAAVTGFTANKVDKLAFLGQPQKVLAFRMATSAAAKGTATLNDAAATPVKSIELETLYPSDRAFVAVVKDGLATGAKRIEITEGGVLLMSVEDTALDGLVSKLNASEYVRVKSQGTTMPANTAGVSFAGGNNGSAVTATEYSAFLTAVEVDRKAQAFALDGVTDEAILTVAETWVRRVRTEGLYITWVRGGVASWDSDLSLANTKSKALNHRGIINVGNGVDGYTSADMAIFGAARVASVALNRTLTDEPVPFKSVNNKTVLVPGNRVVAKESGTLIFVMKGDAVVIDEGVNTLTTPPAGEVASMRKIRVNNALDQIATDLEAFGEEYKRDKSNTDEARATYAATVENNYLAGLQAMDVIKTGYFYEPDPQYHGAKAVYKPQIDEAFFWANVTPVDSMERIYQKIGVSF